MNLDQIEKDHRRQMFDLFEEEKKIKGLNISDDQKVLQLSIFEKRRDEVKRKHDQEKAAFDSQIEQAIQLSLGHIDGVHTHQAIERSLIDKAVIDVEVQTQLEAAIAYQVERAEVLKVRLANMVRMNNERDARIATAVEMGFKKPFYKYERELMEKPPAGPDTVNGRRMRELRKKRDSKPSAEEVAFVPPAPLPKRSGNSTDPFESLWDVPEDLSVGVSMDPPSFDQLDHSGTGYESRFWDEDQFEDYFNDGVDECDDWNCDVDGARYDRRERQIAEEEEKEKKEQEKREAEARWFANFPDYTPLQFELDEVE